MSELSDISSSESLDGPPQIDTREASAGEMLKSAREKAGLHIAALAVSMKVPVKRLEALEADKWELLPDTVFVRALASSVCRALKVDPLPVLQRLPKASTTSVLSEDKSINTPLMPRGPNAANSMFEQLSKPIVLVSLALLIGAAVMIFFPSGERSEGLAPSSSVEAFPSSVIVEQPATASNLQKAEEAAPIVPIEPLVQPALAMSTVVSEVTGPTSSPPAVSSNVGLLVFKSRGSSWIEVADAQGLPQLRRTLEAGDAIEVTGALPLSVVVGRADVIEVQLRGKPFDLQAVTRANVARFEVK